MRFGLAGGGTGGHAYPAVAVAECLRQRPDTDLVYYGTPGGPERALAESEGFAFRPVHASPVRSRVPWKMARGAYNLFRGYREAMHWLEQDQPSAIFATGGYSAAPVGRAARKRGIPLLLFLPDVRPGWAVRSLKGQATAIACSVEDSLAFLPADRTTVTGYPVRSQFAETERSEGARRFGLDPTKQTLLVTGGSLGAHHINLVISQSLRRLLEQTQIIHIAGRDEEPWLARERGRLPQWLQDRYRLHAYTDEMAWAMAAADLAVTRAGASVLGELPAAGLPAIVIPGEFSDQHDNADLLVRHGSAISLSGSEIDGLADEVLRLLGDTTRREAMQTAMRALARPNAAADLARMLEEMAA